MNNKTLKANENKINGAKAIVVELNNDYSKYIYQDNIQYKVHENGAWAYYYSDNNYDYINNNFNLNKIKRIALIFDDSDHNCFIE